MRFKCLFSLFIVPFLVCNMLFAQNKIALLVGVGEYAADTGWDKLSSANDLDLVKAALMRQGFAEENIVLLKDEAVTRTSILEAIETSLEAKASPGSIAVFHYSGHGQQMMDNNKDELDGLDEALVPFDSKKEYVAGENEGDKLIRDDEIGTALLAVRKNIGESGQLLVLMDACHSGTGTRGVRTSRGTDAVMASQAYMDALKENKQKNTDTYRNDSETDAEGLAPMISFFSSQAGQLSYERRGEDGKGYGLLSYAFSKAFAAADKNTSYRALFDQIKRDIQSVTSIQSPQAEGVLDLPLMSNQILGDASYFEVKEVIDDQIISLNAGTLHGVHEGATIGFFPRDTRDISKAKPYAVGKIIYADIIQSDVEFENPVDVALIEGAWAYLLEKNYGSLNVHVQIKTDSDAILTYFQKAFEEYQVIKIVETQADVVLTVLDESNLTLMTIDGHTFASISPLNEATAKVVARQLLGYAQADYLRKLEINNPLMSAQIEVLHNGQATALETLPSYQVGDEIQLVVTNTGQEPFYFSLLDIMPNNEVNEVDMSGGKHAKEELKLAKGQSYTSTKMQVGNPVGVDVFKLVTSSEAMDLSVVKGVNTRNNDEKKKPSNPFETLLQQSDTNTNTRGMTDNMPTSFEVNVETFVFEIKE